MLSTKPMPTVTNSVPQIYFVFLHMGKGSSRMSEDLRLHFWGTNHMSSPGLTDKSPTDWVAKTSEMYGHTVWRLEV
jgi:hypothetical protein